MRQSMKDYRPEHNFDVQKFRKRFEKIQNAAPRLEEMKKASKDQKRSTLRLNMGAAVTQGIHGMSNVLQLPSMTERK